MAMGKTKLVFGSLLALTLGGGTAGSLRAGCGGGWFNLWIVFGFYRVGGFPPFCGYEAGYAGA
jgi:hypothetical protein